MLSGATAAFMTAVIQSRSSVAHALGILRQRSSFLDTGHDEPGLANEWLDAVANADAVLGQIGEDLGQGLHQSCPHAGKGTALCRISSKAAATKSACDNCTGRMTRLGARPAPPLAPLPWAEAVRGAAPDEFARSIRW